MTAPACCAQPGSVLVRQLLDALGEAALVRGLLGAGGLGAAAVASLGLVFVVVRRVDAAREVGLALDLVLVVGASPPRA